MSLISMVGFFESNVLFSHSGRAHGPVPRETLRVLRINNAVGRKIGRAEALTCEICGLTQQTSIIEINNAS